MGDLIEAEDFEYSHKEMAMQSVALRGLNKKVQGFHPSLVGDEIPGEFKARGERERTGREEGLLAELSQVKIDYYLANGHPIPPSRLRHAIEQIVQRDVFGFAAEDLASGYIMGGPDKGKKILGVGGGLDKGGNIQLCAELEDAKGSSKFVGSMPAPSESYKQQFQLASGLTTPQGNTATDRAFIYSWWDTGLYGGTSYLFAAPVMDGLLTLRSRRVGWFQPFLNMGIAPSLTYQIKTRTNNALRQLFTSASGYSKLNTAVVPRKEGRTGSEFLRPKYGSGDMGVRGYMLHSDITAEVMGSIEARRVGAWESSMADLMEGLALIDEYDQVLAFFYGISTGYNRQRKASDNTWNVDTLEVLRGKDNYIGTSFKSHALFYNYMSNEILAPVSHATDFFKHGQGAAFNYGGAFTPAGNQIIELAVALKVLQEKKNRGFEVMSLPFELAVKWGMDSRQADKTKIFGDADPRFKNEPGFMGTLYHPAIGQVSVFGQPVGSIPNDLTTADSVAITGMVIAGEEGQAVTDHLFWPKTVLVSDGMEIVTYDSVPQAIPNHKKVASAFGASGIQPFDMESVSVAFAIAQ